MLPVHSKLAEQADTSRLPVLKNMDSGTITQNVIAINSQCRDARMRYIMERLVTHVHDFARETRLSTAEWRQGIEFLTKTGQKCTDLRQEFILLSDVLGLSMLVDSIDHPKPEQSTPGTVLGPFHTHDAVDMDLGAEMIKDPQGEPLLILCTVQDTEGHPIEGVKIDFWETDSQGFYDVQRPDRKEPNGRGVLRSDANGVFWFKGIFPVEYSIPHDGPVGDLLKHMSRHPFRPAHMHFMFEKEGYDHLITALYMVGDKFESSDAVFGVKDALLVETTSVSPEQATAYNVKEGTKLLTWDFVLVSDRETKLLRDRLAKQAMVELGRIDMNIIDGLPIPDVD